MLNTFGASCAHLIKFLLSQFFFIISRYRTFINKKVAKRDKMKTCQSKTVMIKCQTTKKLGCRKQQNKKIHRRKHYIDSR